MNNQLILTRYLKMCCEVEGKALPPPVEIFTGREKR